MEESNIKQNQQNTEKADLEIDRFEANISFKNREETKGKAENEIDLLEVGSKMWNAGSKLWDALKSLLFDLWKLVSFIIILLRDIVLSIIIFLVRKSLWIISFTIVGMMIGAGLFNFVKPSYLYISEGNTGGIDNSVVIDHVNRLDNMIGDTILIANTLNLTYEQAKSIRYIKACYGIDETGNGKPNYIDISGKKFRHKDSTQTRLPSFVQFRVSLYNKDVMPAVRNGLFQYLNNNNYIQELYRVDRQQREDLIVGLNKEILRLDKIDSVQRERILNKKEDIGTKEGQYVFFSAPPEPEIKLLYEDILPLFERKQVLKKHVELNKQPILIIHDFSPTDRVERPLAWFLIWFGGIMAVFGIICAMIWQYHKRIWEIIQEDSGKKILEQIKEDSTKYKS